MPIKSEWIPFSDKVLKALSLTETGVYELGRRNQVVYIGQGIIRKRLLSHIEKKKFSIVTHFRKRRTSPDEAPRAERKLTQEHIKLYGKKPILNKNLPPDNPWKGILY
jgi:hypothetical protein